MFLKIVIIGLPNAPDWVRGGLGIGKIAIASPLNPPPGSKFDNVLNTAVHEFVHIIVNKIKNNKNCSSFCKGSGTWKYMYTK